MVRDFEPNDMNAFIKCAKEHCKEIQILDELPFDDGHFIKVWRQVAMDPDIICLVYEQGNVIIGYAIGSFHSKIWNPTLYCQLDHFYLHKNERNPYMADNLWNEFVKKAKERGARFIESTVLAHGKDYQGNQDVIKRAGTFFEHKQGNFCGEAYVHNLGEY